MKHLHDDLQECIRDLPIEQQEIIKMQYYYNMTVSDIASWIKKNYSAVRTLKENALRKLRRDKRLKIYKEEIMVKAYRSSFSSWNYTQTSSTERVAIALSDFNNFANWERRKAY